MKLLYKTHGLLQKGMKHLLIFTLFLLNSCTLNQVEVLTDSELSVESAREWFETNGDTKNLRMSGEDDFRKEVFWGLASKQKLNKQDNAVIVPIIHQKKGDYVTFKHLWIYDDKEKKRMARVVEYIYDTQNPKNRIQGLKNFTGLMIFREWDGTFLGGLKIENNKMSGVIGEISVGKKTERLNPNTLKNGRVASTICSWFQYCLNWRIDLFGGSVHGTTCSTEFQCYWLATNGIDPAFTGNVIDIPTIPAGVYGTATGSSDWPVGPPTATNFGFAENRCQGFGIMLDAQSSQDKEISGAITSDGKFIIFPTQNNTKYNVSFSFPYNSPDGNIMVNYIQGNPDAGDPRNDNKYSNDDVSIEVIDKIQRTAILYRITAFIHSHPIESGYDYDNPSDGDRNQAAQFPSKIKNYIINQNKLIEFNTSGLVRRENLPCR